MRDIITVLKGESHDAPSGTAWRRIDPDNVVSVKFNDNEGWSANSYTWYHNGQVISDGKASNLLKDITK